MEASLIAILCFAVIGLAIKLGRMADAYAAVRELSDLVHRLEQRIGIVERQVASLTSNSPANAPHPDASAAQLVAPQTVVAYEPLKVAQADFAQPVPARAEAITRESAIAGSAPPPRPVFASAPALPQQPAPKAAARTISIEERLGQNWLSKIGIVLVVLGVATFLGYKLVTLGPLGKSVTGLTTALILLVGGLLLERKPNYRIFARAGIGGGWALLFFTSFALYHVEAMQVLSSQSADLILMALVASGMVWHSLRYRSQMVTALAFLLAFATVGISHVTLFSLVAGAILAVALVYIAAREYWFELGLAGLCGVYINHFIWLLRVLPHGGQPGQVFADFSASAGLLLLYWAIFRAYYILRVPQNRHQELVASLTAILNSVGLLALLKYQTSHPEWAFAALLTLGTVEFMLAFLARRRWRTAFLVLATLASALLLAAIPFRFAGSNWTLLWLFEAEALFVAGIAIKERALRRIGLIVGFVAALQALLFGALPVLGPRLFAVDSSSHTSTSVALFTAAVLFWFNSEYVRRRWQEEVEEPFEQAALTITSYLAALSMAAAVWLWVSEDWLTIAWGILGLMLFEAGILIDRSTLRRQAYAVFAAAFVRIFVYDLDFNWFGGGHTIGVDHHIGTVVPLVVAAIWVYHRTHTALTDSPSDRAAGVIAIWVGTTTATALVYLEMRPEWIVIGWSLVAMVLITAAWLLRRPIFTAQALALLVAAAGRAAVFNLFLPADAAGAFRSTRATTIGAACAVMFLCLPMALGIRRGQLTFEGVAAKLLPQDPWQGLLSRPEQPFFFVPYALLAILIAFELRTGMITLGWIALGLAAFLAALPIGERSYRLAGLGLLLFGLAKIVFVDIWSLSTTDRIVTLIVTGVVLLLVSFLYARYRETILKFL